MSIHVETSGCGPDLVLLHGWGVTGAAWGQTTTLLAKKFRVHSVDLPGHGASTVCKPYTLDALTDALRAAFSQSR